MIAHKDAMGTEAQEERVAGWGQERVKGEGEEAASLASQPLLETGI